MVVNHRKTMGKWRFNGFYGDSIKALVKSKIILR